MNLLPLLHRFIGKRCLIIGGGKIATRRARSLRRAGAIIDVIAPRIDPPLLTLLQRHARTPQLRAYQRGDITPDYDLVIAATNDPKLNKQLAAQAKAARVPVNVVDNAALCDVAFPSVIERPPLLITVSSGSASPLLSRLLSQRINALIPSAYGRLASLVGRFRSRVRKRIPDTAERIVFWQRILQGAVAESVFSGQRAAAERLLLRALDAPTAAPQVGEVYLLGAGPGDPDLLTLRALRLLQAADIVIYDRLVSKAVLALLDDTPRIYVGKRRHQHSVAQGDINSLLVELAQQGQRVARLKGGDPFIFGRGGEEIEQLAAHHIPFQVIPGITAANGCSCYAGIPLTHRDHAQSVRFVTGQTRHGQLNLPWPQLAQPQQTLVFYMGLKSLPQICAQLIRHGQSATQPAAVVEKGTLPEQRVWVSNLADLPQQLNNQSVRSPALLIVGSVVTLQQKLAWAYPPAGE